LLQLEKRPLAEEVVARIVHLDPSDPLGLQRLLAGAADCGGSPSE
jgi:hypothetical protein